MDVFFVLPSGVEPFIADVSEAVEGDAGAALLEEDRLYRDGLVVPNFAEIVEQAGGVE